MDATVDSDRASPPPEERAAILRPALRAAGVYAAVGAAWILLSDRAVEALFDDLDARALAQTAKGWAFVAVTAGLAFGLVGRAVRERARAQAVQAAAAAEVFRLNRALRAIRAVNEAMLRLGDERELLREVCRVVVEEGGYRMAWVGYRREDERRSVESIAWAGFESGYLAAIDLTWADQPLGRGPTGTAIRTGEPCVVQDFAGDPRTGPWRRLARERGYRSSIALPLLVEGSVLGALTIHASEPQAFTEQEVALLREMAEDLAFGIASIRARAERERLLARLSALHELDRGILRATDPRELAATALEGLRGLVPCDRAGVVLFDAATGLARVFAIVGEVPIGLPEGTTFPASEVAWFEAAERERGVVVPDLLEVRRTGIVERLAELGVRSVLAAALLAEGEHLGAVVLSSREPAAFDEGAREIAREVADQLAVALRHAQLRERIERHAAELERRVEERTAELRERNAELDAFSYSVSHDLRAPLRAMQGFARALLEDHADALGAEGRDHAERIARAAERMDRLISDLLAYSRLGREELTLAPVPLDRLVGDVLELLRAEVEAADATVEVAPGLPSVAADARVLTQVVMNLVGNALRFVEPGVRPQVRVGAVEREGWVRLTVSDNGIGIAPEHRERIFRPLERLHGRERYPGTGMGLAIVRRGVERMGGRCGVESEPGRGSTFWVELRAASTQVEPGPAEAT